VTLAEYRRFRRDHPEAGRGGPEKFTPEPDCPVAGVTWFDAVRYCNWLSKQEGIPEDQWCYPPAQQIGKGMVLPRDHLSRTGYRLPTEAEWECACRAGAVTARHFGRSTDLLDRYAWSLSNGRNHAWPVGRLRPNDWGLFDAHGNVWNWVQDQFQDYRAGLDSEDNFVVNEDHRVLRGGSFFVIPADVRCAYRFHFPPGSVFFSNGFRVARTIR
jgi:formylglycine-generating enzyme required for sulfatase activity